MKRARVAKQSMIRRLNDELVCDLLAQHGPLSRADLAARAHMTSPAALKIVNRLEGAGLVIRAGEETSSRPGPRATTFALADDFGVITSVRATHSTLHATHRSLGGRVLASALVDLNQTSDVAEQVAAVARSPQHGRPQCVVIAMPGAVDPRTGDIAHSTEMPGWRPGTAAAVRAALAGTPITFENEVNVRALAESRRGVAQGHSDFLLLSLGSGVGAALVLDGRTRSGAHGAAGEVGFLIADQADGLRRYQDVAGAWELAHVVGAEHDLSFTWMHDLVSSDDHMAWDAIAAAISPGILTMSAIVDPQLVVLAGEVARIAGTPLLEAVERWVHANTELPPPAFALSTLGDDAVLEGAFAQGWQALLASTLGRPEKN